MNTIAEIYGLRHKNNGLYFYVGSSIHPEIRLKQHFKDAKYKRFNKKLSEMLNNNKDDITLDILDVVFDNEDRYQIEKQWLNTLKLAKHPVVNIVDPTYHYRGNRPPIKPTGMKGMKHSDLAKERMREARKNRIFTDETKKKISLSKQGDKNPMYGTVGTHKGIPVTEKTKRQQAFTMSKSGITRFTIIDWLLEDIDRLKLFPNEIKMIFPTVERSVVTLALREARNKTGIKSEKYKYTDDVREKMAKNRVHGGATQSDIINWLEQDLSRCLWGWGAIQETAGSSLSIISRALKTVKDKHGITRPKQTDKYYKC